MLSRADETSPATPFMESTASLNADLRVSAFLLLVIETSTSFLTSSWSSLSAEVLTSGELVLFAAGEDRRGS